MCQAAVADEKVPLVTSDYERKMGHEHKAFELRNAYLRVNSCPQEHLKGLSRVSGVRERQSRRVPNREVSCDSRMRSCRSRCSRRLNCLPQ
jgi:hypothetical protein